jgi:hypothetical protein
MDVSSPEGLFQPTTRHSFANSPDLWRVHPAISLQTESFVLMKNARRSLLCENDLDGKAGNRQR